MVSPVQAIFPLFPRQFSSPRRESFGRDTSKSFAIMDLKPLKNTMKTFFTFLELPIPSLDLFYNILLLAFPHSVTGHCEGGFWRLRVPS